MLGPVLARPPLPIVLIQSVHYNEGTSESGHTVDHYVFVMGGLDTGGMLCLLDQSVPFVTFSLYFQGRPLSSVLHVIMLVFIVLFQDSPVPPGSSFPRSSSLSGQCAILIRRDAEASFC